MRVMITGANGFLGRALVMRLLASGGVRGRPIDALLLLDQRLEGFPQDQRLRGYQGSVTDAALIRRALADGIDVVFHLASVPGGAAETDYECGYRVNLQASLELLQQLRNAHKPPRLVYASTVAVYGAPLPPRMDDAARCTPTLSYACHKLIVETQLADLLRRGEIDGVALRLPGVVARSDPPNGLKSAFMSELLQAVAAGQPYLCPVSAEATAWWMSARCAVDNLIRAAELEAFPQPVLQVPALHLSIAQVLDALASCLDVSPQALVRFAPDPALEALFGRFPPLRTPRARALGFRHDGSATALIRHALDLSPSRRRRAASSLQGIPT